MSHNYRDKHDMTLLHFFHEIEFVERAALEAFRGGWGSGGHWDTLAECRNMLWFGAQKKSAESEREVARRALHALRSIREREQRTGRFGCTADELNVLHALVETSRDFWVRQAPRRFTEALSQCAKLKGTTRS